MKSFTEWLANVDGPVTQMLLMLGATRTSLTWFIARVTSFATAIVSYALPLNELGVSPEWVRRIHIIAVIVLLIAGKYGTSPLPKGDDK